MPSSKFGGRATQRRTPAICKKPPLIAFPLLPLTKPNRVIATCLWHDFDPLAYTKIEQIIPLTLSHLGTGYHGTGPKTPDYLAVDAWELGGGPNWTFRLRIWNAFHSGYAQWWSPIHVDQAQPFDSGHLTDIVLPGQDWRLLRVRAA